MGSPPSRSPEREVRGAQPPGMQGFGGAAPKVQRVRGAQPPGMREVRGAAPPRNNIYIYTYINNRQSTNSQKVHHPELLYP